MCPDLFLLSAIACKLAEIFTKDELSVLSANILALGDLLQVILANQDNTE